MKRRVKYASTVCGWCRGKLTRPVKEILEHYIRCKQVYQKKVERIPPSEDGY